MDNKVKIAAGVGAVGLVAIVVMRRRSAATAAASASSPGIATSDTYASYLPVSTGVSTSGQYAVDTGAAYSSGSGSGSSDASTFDPSKSVASYAQLLQGILSSGSQFAQQAQSNAAANNSAAVSAINAATPAPASAQAPQPAPAWDGSLSEIVGGRFVPNTALYATDNGYRTAWDRSASWNANGAAGSNWNVVGKGVSQADLDKEIKNVLPW
jgi:hypothetical protein